LSVLADGNVVIAWTDMSLSGADTSESAVRAQIFALGETAPPPPPSGLVLTGTALSNTLVGGAGNDTVTGLGGKDTLTGAAGFDIFAYGAVSHSTSRNYDTITDLDGASDVLDFWFQVTGVDTSITGRSIGSRRFDSDLASAVNSSKLAAHHAVLYTPNSGVPAGSNFLIVDVNGVAGYQAGADVVILLGANSTNLGSLTVSDFV
jgi:hypothetical protein